MTKSKTTDEQELFKTKRPYYSPRRQEQAMNTHRRIMEAAMTLLVEKGFATLSMEDVAQLAGVAHQTVYAACGSKKGMLTSIFEYVKSQGPYRELLPQITAIPNGPEMIRSALHSVITIYHKRAPLVRLMAGAPIVSSELASLGSALEQMRHDNIFLIVQALEKCHGLKEGLSTEIAADLYWAISNPSNHLRLVEERGWSEEEYMERISKLLIDTLLK